MSWLTDFVTAFALVIPRLTVVTTIEAGVKFVRGSQVKAFGPGLVWHWPLTTEMQVIEVARQPLDVPTKTLTTKDGRQVIASGLVMYRITDVEAYLTRNADTDEAVVESGAAAIYEIVTSKTWRRSRRTRTTRSAMR